MLASASSGQGYELQSVKTAGGLQIFPSQNKVLYGHCSVNATTGLHITAGKNLCF